MTIEELFIGPFSGLLPELKDERLTDILLNGSQSLFVEVGGRLEEREHPFPDETLLFQLAERVLAQEGRSRNALCPFVDGRLPDGSRYHLLFPPVVVGAPHFSFRKWHRRESVTLEDFGPEVFWLSDQVAFRKNILISGGTGSGKTTLLGRLLDLCESSERLVLLEESREIQTAHGHTVRLESCAPTWEGTGEVNLGLLLKNSLRMRPDRIILGEVRGSEAFTMIQAMNTGHRGSMTTLHANSARDALERLVGLALLAPVGLSVSALRAWIGRNIDFVVHLEKGVSGRKIKEILKVQGVEGEVFRLTPQNPGSPLHVNELCEKLLPLNCED